MSNNPVILSFENVSKKFCRSLKRSLFYGMCNIVSEMTGRREQEETLRKAEFWALRNVNLQLRQGEALGLIGPNGAGKTTLLRIISGLIKLDTGTVRIKGRIAPLIALQAGFNPILTGRENIYVNMSILGVPNREIRKRFDDVVAFAEIEDALDSPLQTYSSGMAARLGFACAIHTDPEILLIDEVLAVGDLKFRLKCFRKLHELSENGTAFILISHNPYAIMSVCSTAAYLLKGRLVAMGEPDAIVSRYEEELFMNNAGRELKGVKLLPEEAVEITSLLSIRALFFRDRDDNLAAHVVSGQAIQLCVICSVTSEIDGIVVTVMIDENFEERRTVLCLNNMTHNDLLHLFAGDNEIQVQMPYCGLRPGTYSMTVTVRNESLSAFDRAEGFKFKVVSPHENMSTCLFYQPRTLQVIRNSTWKKFLNKYIPPEYAIETRI